ncbi:HopJ type III effector protein [Mucilaginibacter roseus]|uniref:HopJ type III effector protein n=1 Tax=Mucilaginibacter roseus TaxID=1528868 RepID=A0ABS8TWQ2_9SPHI|nr:HopJ type III effector protein [Mucilaginibacter roseus]MCD8739251.1 HopJ type III effector protein [Mucilaginibacter roseus]
MKDQIDTLLLKAKQDTLAFSEVLEFIEKHYQHTPTAFKNGDVYNEATQNQGSAKVLGFAQLNELNAENTLLLFAEHYRAVLADPEGEAHQNIRQFMAHGWDGIAFEGEPLAQK